MRGRRGGSPEIVLPFHSIVPDRGVRNPAMTSSSDVLPAPDGPYTAVERAVISTETSSAKSANGRMSSRMTSTRPVLQHQLGRPDRGEVEDVGNRNHAGLIFAVPHLHVVRDRERAR